MKNQINHSDYQQLSSADQGLYTGTESDGYTLHPFVRKQIEDVKRIRVENIDDIKSEGPTPREITLENRLSKMEKQWKSEVERNQRNVRALEEKHVPRKHPSGGVKPRVCRRRLLLTSLPERRQPDSESTRATSSDSGATANPWRTAKEIISSSMDGWTISDQAMGRTSSQGRRGRQAAIVYSQETILPQVARSTPISTTNSS